MWRVSKRVLAAVGITLAAAGNAQALDDLKWVHPSADSVIALTEAPAECLAMPEDPDRAYLVNVGRVAFRAPLLLGGIAARSRVSCDTCHQNGHDNPHFFFQGVSDGPGTADVTGGVFSKSRDDGEFNPVPIPSLVDAAPPFGTMVPAETLHAFLQAAITEEFQGRPPPAAVMTGLEAYIDALRSGACPAGGINPISLGSDINRVEEALGIAAAALGRNDPATAEFALLALQSALGRIHDRYAGFPADQQELIELSGFFGDVRPLIADEPDRAREELWKGQIVLAAAAVTLKAHEAESLYNPSVLRAWLQRQKSR